MLFAIFKQQKGIPIVYHKHGSANPVERSKLFTAEVYISKIFRYCFKFMLSKSEWIIAIDRLCFQQAVSNGAAGEDLFIDECR